MYILTVGGVTKLLDCISFKSISYSWNLWELTKFLAWNQNQKCKFWSLWLVWLFSEAENFDSRCYFGDYLHFWAANIKWCLWPMTNIYLQKITLIYIIVPLSNFFSIESSPQPKMNMTQTKLIKTCAPVRTLQSTNFSSTRQNNLDLVSI